jgi:cysteine sulfinate desulfinase/cysteine desulfurase-like protein
MIYLDYNATTPVLPEVLGANAELKDTEDKNTFTRRHFFLDKK